MADGNHLVLANDRAVALGPTYEQVKEMAHYFARSGMFGVKTPEQAFSLLMIAQSEGLHPARAMQEYHVIQNRPTLKAEAMLGRFQQAGGKVKWIKHENDEVIAEFTHDASGTTEVSWNMERAKQAGITGNGTWGKYPRQMLRARVISEGVRLSYPACIVGFYAPEELASDEPTPPVEPLTQQQTPEPTRSESLIDQINACETMNDLEQLALQKTSDIIAMPEKDRSAAQKAIAAKRKDLANAPKDAEFVERDPDADKAFIEKFCEFVADRPNKETLDALWAKYKERLASIQAADPELYDEAVKADALKQQEFQAAEMAAE